MTTVELRCPDGPRKLFAKLKVGEESGRYLPDNTLEISCWDCAKRISQERQHRVRVLHRFNFIGELVKTVVEDATPALPNL